jgi:predicted permease
MAISVVVLICAGLFMRSSAAASRMQLGFRGDHIALLSTALRAQRYDSTQGLALYGELVRRTAAIPGVRAVALTKYVPFGFDRDNINVFPIASAVQVPPNGFGYRTNVISGDYFTAMGIPLLAGRSFTDRDNQTAQQVAIVNDALANTLWPGQPTLGKRVHVGSATGPLLEIVGVARGAQDMIPGETPQPTLYRPLGQSYRADMTLIVQTSAEPSSLVPTLRSTIASLDPSLPIFDVRTMAEHLQNGQAFLFTRIGTAFASVFGLLALVLATVGVYGVVSYSVAQRTREIGVRVALGAGLTSILGLVVRQGLMLAWVGGAIGLVLSFTTTGVLSSILYGVGPRDPVVLGVVLGGLTIVAALASFVPARRAAQIDPIKALRAE